MTYQPLHHKYRPQTFAQLVGQDAIATTLSNALSQRRIAPAYLFTGARGTGKTSSARIFAKSLNCIAVTEPTDAPCGVCETCQAITTGSALDVVEIDAASNAGVDKIREVIERAQFSSVHCRYKVYILDEAHSLSGAAFNALLKTLEEPPDRVVFILATTDPQRVLPTIISRCQRYNFQRIDQSAIAKHLAYIAHQEGISIHPTAIDLIASLSQGGLRDAQSLLDQLSLLSGEITTEQVYKLVGAIPESALLELLKAIVHQDEASALDQIRCLTQSGKDALSILQGLAGMLRDLCLAMARTRANLSRVMPSTWQELCELASQCSRAQVQSLQTILRESEPQIRQSKDAVLWLESLILEVSSDRDETLQRSLEEPDKVDVRIPSPTLSNWESALASLEY